MIARSICSLVALFSALALNAAQPEWKPVAGKMMTPWGDQVTPGNAWAEYPRPEFARERRQNLNGLWDYAPRRGAAAAPNNFDGKILVPYCVESTLSGVGKTVTPNDRIWYRRAF